jgi:protease IV
MKKKRDKLQPLVYIVLGVVGLITFFIIINSFLDYTNVALIPIKGTIVTEQSSSLLGQDVTTSTEIKQFIKEANEDPLIEVIVLEINSPGGSAVASDEIGQAVKDCNKPVVAYIREYGASGGYWIASTADIIIANKMSITGSIGVISSFLEFSDLMENYGVGYESFVSGKYKEMGTPFKKMNNEERTIMQNKIDLIHQMFVEEVANNRNMSKTEIEKIATGEFYLGIEAYELGLIDHLGNENTLNELLTTKYNLEYIEYKRYEKKVSLLNIFATTLNSFGYKIGAGLGQSMNQKTLLQV